MYTREEALERVEQGANPAFLDAAYQAVVLTAKRLPEFIVDEVWNSLVAPPTTQDNRAMGVAIRRALKAGIITPSQSFQPSVRSHMSPRRVWKSVGFQQ